MTDPDARSTGRRGGETKTMCERCAALRTQVDLERELARRASGGQTPAEKRTSGRKPAAETNTSGWPASSRRRQRAAETRMPTGDRRPGGVQVAGSGLMFAAANAFELRVALEEAIYVADWLSGLTDLPHAPAWPVMRWRIFTSPARLCAEDFAHVSYRGSETKANFSDRFGEETGWPFRTRPASGHGGVHQARKPGTHDTPDPSIHACRRMGAGV